MGSEWNLSDKIMRWFPDGEPNHVVYAEDVREFIKRLKDISHNQTEAVKGKNVSKNWKEAFDVANSIFREAINKLAGEKLI